MSERERVRERGGRRGGGGDERKRVEAASRERRGEREKTRILPIIYIYRLIFQD